MKKKILAYCDSPNVKTGFGTVSRNILRLLYQTGKYDIDIFGINYHGTPHDMPFNIWPAADPSEGDPYGRKKFCYFAMQHDFDILWIVQDTFIVDFIPELLNHLNSEVSSGARKPFRTIMYYPTDSIIKDVWARNIKDVDKLVSYTDFGKKALGKHIDVTNVDIIYHGANFKDFYPLPESKVLEFKKDYFKSHADKFIFMNVNRNQQRKDIPRTIAAFKEFKKEVPESVLYLHMAKKDQGWDLMEVCAAYDLSSTEDIIMPENFEPNQAYPVEILNLLYNCADCIISTTLGEGFGLGWIEAMATNTPVIFPDNTAMRELITEDKGYLVKSGSNPSLWTCIPNDNDILRPLVDVEDMVKVMLEVYNNYPEAILRSENAYKWVLKELNWDGKIAQQWRKVFDNEVNALKHIEFSNKLNNKTISSEQL